MTNRGAMRFNAVSSLPAVNSFCYHIRVSHNISNKLIDMTYQGVIYYIKMCRRVINAVLLRRYHRTNSQTILSKIIDEISNYKRVSW